MSNKHDLPPLPQAAMREASQGVLYLWYTKNQMREAQEAVRAQFTEHIQRLEAEAQQANEYARQLAVAIHAKYYPEVTQWKPLPDLMGVLTQIDNMTAGLVMPGRLEAENEALRGAIHDEMDEGLRLRDLGGAGEDENITAMTERVIRERDALKSASEMHWRPITSAPKDGSAFRGFSEDLIDLDFNPQGSVECAFNGEEFIGCVWNGQQDAWYGKPVRLTHWMPLPPPPEQKT